MEALEMKRQYNTLKVFVSLLVLALFALPNCAVEGSDEASIIKQVSGIQMANGIALDATGSIAWVTEEVEYTGRLVRADLASGAVTPITSDLHLPGHLVVVGQRAFVAGNIGAPVTLVQIDLKDGSVTPISTDLGGGLSSVAVNGELSMAYVVNYGAGVLSRVDIDPSSPTFKEVTQIVTGLIEPRDIVIDKSETVAYVTEQGAGRLVQIIIEPTAPGYGTITPIVDGLRGPRGLTLTQNGDLMYLAEEFAGKLNVVDVDQDSAEYGSVTTILHYPHLRDVALSTDERTAVLTAAEQGVLLVDLGSSMSAVKAPSTTVKALSTPRVCATVIEAPAPFGSFPPVRLDFAQPGYAAEWYVAPGAFNMPQEVLLTPQGDLLVHAVRSGKLSRVADDGTVTLVAEDVWAYLGDVDAQGNLYLHSHPGGRVTRVSPDGAVTIVAESRELQSACDSGFGIGPDGNMYLALNSCSPTADLIQITPAGQIAHVAHSIPWMSALRTMPAGRFLGVGHEIYEISLDKYSLTTLGPNPAGGVSPGGMAVDDAGNIYISNGAREVGGSVYCVTSSGDARLLAEIPVNGLSGIEWWPKTGEIVGGQLRQGGLIAIAPDGTLREIVPGNGLVTPMGIAFSPCGEMAVGNDDGGMMALVNPTGEVAWFFDYPSFTPPTPFVAFAPDGTLYASVGAPHMPELILAVPPGETPRSLVNAAMPCGLAYRGDGTMFMAETSAGRITQINPDGSTAVFVDGLNFPQDLVLDNNSNLYVLTGPAGFRGDTLFNTPNDGDTVIRITPDGVASTVAYLRGIAALALGPSGDLFVASGSRVTHILPDGTVTAFANGLRFIRGLAFDLAGNLYASDADLNGIVRIGGFPQGTLKGVVRDSQGNPIAGACIQVVCDRPIVVGQVVISDANGIFSLPAAPRSYALIITAEGHDVVTLKDIKVTTDQETNVEVELK